MFGLVFEVSSQRLSVVVDVGCAVGHRANVRSFLLIGRLDKHGVAALNWADLQFLILAKYSVEHCWLLMEWAV